MSDMRANLSKQPYGILGLLLNIPAVVIYIVFVASRFIYDELVPVSFLIPSSEASQIFFLAGLPFVGLVVGITGYHKSEKKTFSKAAIAVSSLLLLFILFAAFARKS